MPTLNEDALRLLFQDARTHRHWLPDPVDDSLLHRLHDEAKMAPTASNIEPMRLLFVKSASAKERLRPALAPANVDKTITAPVTAVVAFDGEFHERLPRLDPRGGDKARDRFRAAPASERESLARVNAWLQAGYLILAARALGLDCGPMLGFDTEKVDAEFFAPEAGESRAWRSIVLVNLGHGDAGKLHPRAPRLDFDEACRIA